MDYSTASFEELDQHAMEQLVFETTELSPILRGHIFIENIIEVLISKNLPNPKALFSKNRSFELKLDLAKAMGLIDEKHYSSFKSVNIIRNNYAHKSSYKITIKDINCIKFDWTPIQNKAYEAACTKGIDEAIKIAMLFTCWKAIYLVNNTNA